jgi:methionyl aminopeptidase
LKKAKPVANNGVILRTAAEIELMRQAGRIVAACLQKVQAAAQPGVSGEVLDALAEATIRELGGKPSFKGYRGFPASICLSLNDEVVHGIPQARKIAAGDIVKVDVGAIFEGYHADAARSFGVGEIPEAAQNLLRVTKAALYKGIDQCRPGKRVVDISRAVQDYAEHAGYSVVRDLVGHGIGQAMHEPLQIPNFVTGQKTPALKVGMTFAIEPMVNMGDWKIKREADGWTCRTYDGSLSAHFEHTVAITEEGPAILTQEGAGREEIG